MAAFTIRKFPDDNAASHQILGLILFVSLTPAWTSQIHEHPGAFRLSYCALFEHCALRHHDG
jgi:hypothetical protein